VFWPMTQAPEVLRFYRDWVADAPDELMTIVINRKAPPLPFVPPELHGKPVVVVACCWAGDIEEGERFIRPLKAFGSPVLDACVPKPFLTHQAMFDPSFPKGRWYYFKSCDVAELTDEIIDITVEHCLRISSPLTSFPIWQMGGAVSRVGDAETAFNGRSTGFTYNIGASTETSAGFAEEREWVQNFWSALQPWHQGVYVNFLGDEGADRIRQAYGPKKYVRLQALKRKYDPDNFFQINQNIPPNYAALLAPTSVDDGAAGLDRVDDDPELAQLASLRHRVHAGAPPHLILHGDRDVMVNHEQSRVLHEALSAVGAQPICLLIMGAGRDPLTLGGLLSMSQCTVFLSWGCNGR
jgi:hypothetical protein